MQNLCTIEDKLKESRQKCFIGYGNSKVQIEAISEKYGTWLDKVGYKSDYVTITGSLKKEQKFYYTNLFCEDRDRYMTRLENLSDDDRPFNAQVMIATSGAANAGIDNPNVHGAFRYEFPPSIEDCIQEEGRAGRRVGADSSTDWYTICISLESFFRVLRLVLTSEESRASYRQTLITDLHVCLSVFVLPTHCFRSVFAHKCSNPFISVQHMPPSCVNSCSFCLGECKDMFPAIIRESVTSVLLDLFVGSNRIEGRVSIGDVLIKNICAYKSVNRIIFGIKTHKPPAPVTVKKMILVLLAAGILGYDIVKKKTSKDNKEEITYGEIFGFLSFTRNSDGAKTNMLALHDDVYWSRVLTI